VGNHVANLLQVYLDGETGVADSVAIERHLPECTLCRAELQHLKDMSRALHQRGLYYEAPQDLKDRVQRRLNSNIPKKSFLLTHLFSIGLRDALLGVAVGAALTLLIQFGVPPISPFSNTMHSLEQQLVDDHIRSLSLNHLIDVASTDQHTVKPWFNGKLDFAPIVNDFSSQGFPLLGGRLDVIEGHPVAALVYQRRQHYINVFERPDPKSSVTSLSSFTEKGFHLRYWTRQGMQFFVVSDLNMDELAKFAELLQR
jgi:anti-sigma factor RsiW